MTGLAGWPPVRECFSPASGMSIVYSVPRASRIWKKQWEGECILFDVQNFVLRRPYPSFFSQGKAHSGLRSKDVRGEGRFWFRFLKDEGSQGKYRRRTEAYFGHSVTFSFSSRPMWSCNICVCVLIYLPVNVIELTLLQKYNKHFHTGLERKGFSGVYSYEF